MQETMVILAPPLISISSFMVVVISSLREFKPTNVGCTNKILYEISTGTSISLALNQSYA